MRSFDSYPGEPKFVEMGMEKSRWMEMRCSKEIAEAGTWPGLEEKQDSVEGGIVSTMRRADPGSSGEDWVCFFVMGAIRDS